MHFFSIFNSSFVELIFEALLFLACATFDQFDLCVTVWYMVYDEEIKLITFDSDVC